MTTTLGGLNLLGVAVSMRQGFLKVVSQAHISPSPQLSGPRRRTLAVHAAVTLHAACGDSWQNADAAARNAYLVQQY